MDEFGLFAFQHALVDMPGLKTVGGIATMGGFQSAWFKDSEGNILAVSDEPN